jgi:hypothetical protein
MDMASRKNEAIEFSCFKERHKDEVEELKTLFKPNEIFQYLYGCWNKECSRKPSLYVMKDLSRMAGESGW